VKKPAVRYVLAFLITIASAVWQRNDRADLPRPGPRHLGGAKIGLKLTRTHGGDGTSPSA